MIIWFLTHCWVPGALRIISMTVALPVMKGTFYLTKKTSHGARKRPWARGALPSLSDTRSQRHTRPLLLSMLFNEDQQP